jgi:hypothetical protein
MSLGSQRLSAFDHRRLDVNADALARHDRLSEAERDRPGPAADVEDAHAGSEVRQEEPGSVGSGPALELRFEWAIPTLDVGLGHRGSLGSRSRILSEMLSPFAR